MDTEDKRMHVPQQLQPCGAVPAVWREARVATHPAWRRGEGPPALPCVDRQAAHSWPPALRQQAAWPGRMGRTAAAAAAAAGVAAGRQPQSAKACRTAGACRLCTQTQPLRAMLVC